MDNASIYVLKGTLFIIMTGMGLSLTLDDFRRVVKFPMAVLAGLLSQIVLLPIIAYTLAIVLKVDSTIAMGAMILSACPGGPASNLVTYLAKGDVALSVTLTAINSLITIITIPLIVNFALIQFIPQPSTIDAPVMDIIQELIMIIAVPLALGMFINKVKPTFAQKMDKPVRIASMVLIVVVIAGLCVKERANLVQYIIDSWVMVLSMNIGTMGVGFILARLFRLNLKQSIAICIESGNQSGTLAIHIASKILMSPPFAIVAGIYSLSMYFTALIPIFVGNKKHKELEETSK
ncbi:MAG: bile acid:sodium symporter family protein [Cytophagales bacterium]|nr:bile acid:sodium symporter family protein [Cytophagales bacterium]